jgi:hypothetical protein
LTFGSAAVYPWPTRQARRPRSSDLAAGSCPWCPHLRSGADTIELALDEGDGAFGLETVCCQPSIEGLLGSTPRPPAVGPPTPPKARPKVSRFPTPHRRLTRHYYERQRRQKARRRCDLPLADIELPANMPAIPESQLSKTRRSACLRPVVGKRDVSTSPSGPSHARAAVDRCSSGDTG